MSAFGRQLRQRALDHAPLLLFAVVLAFFGALAPNFLTVANGVNILIQTAATATVAVGMTFVLLTAGVDLSVGAIMFVGAAVAAKLARAGYSLPVAVAAVVLVGVGAGMVNAWLITRWRILAFVATLGTLYLGRGLALWITETRAMNLPESYLQLGTARWLGVPLPIWMVLLVAGLAQTILSSTPYGRQLYAVGQDADAARKAGIPVRNRLASVYVLCGLTAALGALVTLGQLGAVSPKFGENYEFRAIAAAVLGGTSLFGGRGKVVPGTLLGAILMQTVDNGLVMLNADPYLYPLVTGGIIFLAVLIDSARLHWLSRLARRPIRIEP